MPKFVFISHEMSGDVEGNMEKVAAICQKIQSTEIIPMFPSALTRRYKEPRDVSAIKFGIAEYFRSKKADELWLYGDKITEGMKKEIKLARENNIPVSARTSETEKQLIEEEL